MNQKTATPAKLHADHRKWQGEISTWQDDVNEWQIQIQLALEQLEQFTAMIRREKTEVDRHSGALLDIAKSLGDQEKLLATMLQAGEEPGSGDEFAGRHAAVGEQMATRRKTHVRLRHKHQAVMVQATAIEKVLEAVEPG